MFYVYQHYLNSQSDTIPKHRSESTWIKPSLVRGLCNIPGWLVASSDTVSVSMLHWLIVAITEPAIGLSIRTGEGSQASLTTCTCSRACILATSRAITFLKIRNDICESLSLPSLHNYKQMAYCATCSARFKGSGHHCALHKSDFRRSRTQEYYNYSSDSAYPGDTHFRTNQGTDGIVARRRPHHHDGYNEAHVLALYHTNHNMPSINTPLAHTLAQSFATLQDTHVIASLTYSITPNGTQTLTAEANLEREQCPVCYAWFPNHEKLKYHQWENPVGCEAHQVCMRAEDALWHGTKERHERCFVRSCESVYRREGGWRAGAVEEHVKGWHYCV